MRKKIDGTPPENPEEFDIKINELEESVDVGYSLAYASTYGTTRVIAQIIAFIGWIIVTISGLLFIATIAKASQSRSGIEWFGLLPAFSGFVSGLFLVMSGQLTRATVDNTDNTGRLLSLLREIANKH